MSEGWEFKSIYYSKFFENAPLSYTKLFIVFFFKLLNIIFAELYKIPKPFLLFYLSLYSFIAKLVSKLSNEDYEWDIKIQLI